jgi:hypothetical protein
MKDVTGEEVRTAVLASGISRIDHHTCSICGCMTYYEVEGQELFFNPNCGCTKYFTEPYPRSWDNAAEFINMQSTPSVRAEVAESFGFAGVPE